MTPTAFSGPGVPAPAPAPAFLPGVAVGGASSDAALVDAALRRLAQSPSGAPVVAGLLNTNARINVLSNEEFAAAGHADAHAFYTPRTDSIYLRRSDLQRDPNMAAVELAHEGTHLLDDKAGLDDRAVAQATQAIAAIGDRRQQDEAVKQTIFELTMIKEARAFTYAGSVARELGIALPAGDPTRIAAEGTNDRATYERVWQALLNSSYNAGRRAAPPLDFTA